MLKKSIWSGGGDKKERVAFWLVIFSWENIWVLLSGDFSRLEWKIKTVAVVGRWGTDITEVFQLVCKYIPDNTLRSVKE